MKICLAIHCLYGLIRTFFILTKSKMWGSTLSESWRIKFMNEWWSWTQTSTMSLLLSGSFSGREGQELFDKIRQVVPWYFSCYSLSPKLPNYNYKLYKKSITVFTGKGKKKNLRSTNVTIWLDHSLCSKVWKTKLEGLTWYIDDYCTP